MSGCITEEEFRQQCFDLVSLSDKISDGWQIKKNRDDVFIVKETKLSVSFRDQITALKAAETLGDYSRFASTNNAAEKPVQLPYCEPDSSNDCVSLPELDSLEPNNTLGPGTTSCLVTFQYHVVFSSAYNVPVLYFNAWHSTGRLLKLEEVWGMAPASSDQYSYITQVEHPLLARPFFEIHPCRTEKLMGQLAPRKYLISWISAVGRDVGLSLDIKYAMF